MFKKRSLILLSAVMFAAVFCFLVLFSFGDSISFFYSPSEIINFTKQNKNVRLGGKIESIEKHEDYTSFIIADDKNSIEVLYSGTTPSLMREGIDIVVSGRLVDDKFMANQVLLKHDERYYPKK